MTRTIRIAVGSVSLPAVLYENPIADAIWDALPIDQSYSAWGDEIYFSVSIHLEVDEGQEIVEIGDLAYWPPGHAFCIFFGKTPASTDNRPRAASEVIVFGRIEGDATVLRNVRSSKIQVEKGES